MSEHEAPTAAGAADAAAEPEPVQGAPATRAQQLAIIDGALQNLITNMGVANLDKRTGSKYTTVPPFQRNEIESMWRNTWLAGRIVDAPADDMTREWVHCTWNGYDDDDSNAQALEDAEEKVGLQETCHEALNWSRLYGGAAVIPLIDGDDDTSVPLDIDLIRPGSLHRFHVLDRWRISPTGVLDEDRSSANFGRPVAYQLVDGAYDAPLVHWSRVCLFRGRKLPYWLWREQLWDDSVLQSVMDDVTDYDTMRTLIGSMMFEANVDVISTKSMQDLMSTADGEQEIQRRWQLAALLKSIHRILLIDGDDKHSQKTNTFAGLPEIWKQAIINICGAAHIPVTILFGTSPQGFSTGDTDIRAYYDRIKKDQKKQLRPQLSWMYKILLRSELPGGYPKNFKFTFNPLWQVPATDQATIEKTNADRDVAYVNAGVVGADLVARELYDRRTYRTMEKADVEATKQAMLEQPVDDPNDPAARSAGKKAGAAGAAGAAGTGGAAGKKKKTPAR